MGDAGCFGNFKSAFRAHVTKTYGALNELKSGLLRLKDGAMGWHAHACRLRAVFGALFAVAACCGHGRSGTNIAVREPPHCLQRGYVANMQACR